MLLRGQVKSEQRSDEWMYCHGSFWWKQQRKFLGVVNESSVFNPILPSFDAKHRAGYVLDSGLIEWGLKTRFI